MWCERPAPWITPNNPNKLPSAWETVRRVLSYWRAFAGGRAGGRSPNRPPDGSCGLRPQRRLRRRGCAPSRPLRRLSRGANTPLPSCPLRKPSPAPHAPSPPALRKIKTDPRHRQAPLRRSCRGQGLFSAPVVFRAAGRHGRRKAAAGKRFGRWQRRDWAALWPQAPSAVPPAGGKTARQRSPSCKCG